MKREMQQHNIETAFVLLLFAIYAVMAIAVLALGANSYRALVRRDNENYNKRIITSYVAAKIRNHDTDDGAAVGGFARAGEQDGIETLHLYEEIEGARYDVRIYYYDGYIRELFTLENLDLEPGAGNKVMEAEGLSLEQSGRIIRILATDSDGRKNDATVALRSESGVGQ